MDTLWLVLVASTSAGGICQGVKGNSSISEQTPVVILQAMCFAAGYVFQTCPHALMQSPSCKLAAVHDTGQ